MTGSLACPDDAVLRAALHDGLGDELLVHVASCDGCRARLAALEADDRFLARARAALAPEAGPVPAADDLVPGYHLRRTIAQGGQGTVHEAIEEGTGRRVAVKVLGRRARITTKERLRFEREAQLAARLHHPNIARVLASGTARDGRPYLVMEFVEGVPLDEHPLYREAQDALGRDAAAHRAAIVLLRTLAEAMAVAHGRGVIHRDLKPSNILVDARGEPHVIDFGLARTAQPDLGGATITGEFVGSVAYASPEQLAGERDVDARADVHALGVIGYELLLGSSPYEDETSIGRTVQVRLTSDPRPPRRIDPRIERDLDAILRTAVARDPDRRYPSAEAFARDLRLHLEGRPIEVRRDSSWYVVRRTIRRHRFAIGVATTVLLLAIAVAAAMTLSWRRATDAEALARARASELEDALLVGQLEQARLALSADDVVRAESLAWSVVGASAAEAAAAGAERRSSIATQANWVLRGVYERAPSLHAVRLGGPISPGTMCWTPDGDAIEVLRREGGGVRWRPGEATPPAPMSSAGRLVGCRGLVDRTAEVLPDEIVLRTDDGRERRVPCVDGDDPVQRVAADRDGETLLVLRASGRVDVMDGAGAVRTSLSRAIGARLAVSPSGRWAAISDEDRRIGVWDLAALRRIGAVGSDRSGNVRFAPDDSMLAVAEGGEVVLHRLGGLGRVRTLSGLHSWATDLAFDADGRRLVAGGWDRVVAVWRVVDGALVATCAGHAEDVWGVAFSPDGTRIASIDAGGEVRVWSAAPIGAVQRARFSDLSVLDGAPVPGTDLLGVALESGEVVLVDLHTRLEQGRWRAHEGIVSAVAALPDGSGVVSAGFDGQVCRFALDGTRRWSAALDIVISDVAIDPAGRTIAAACVDGSVRLLDAADGAPVATVRRHARRVAAVAFSPDGARLASGGVDGELALGAPEAESAPIVARLTEGVIRAIAFDAHGTRLAFAGDDRRVHVLDLATGAEEAVLEGHRGSVFAIAFDRSGTRLASLDSFGALHIAVADQWTTVLSTIVHDTMGFAVLFAPDDETIVTTSRDGTVAVRSLDGAESCIAGMRRFWLGDDDAGAPASPAAAAR